MKRLQGKLVPIVNDCFEDGFYIPENVVIIGAMNDIDRSVETFDFALRRRFDWVEIEADKVMESSLVSMGVPTDLVPGIKAKAGDDKRAGDDGINGIIEKSGLGKEFKIGPAYFKGYDGTEEKLEEIWRQNIRPILQEYMRGRQGAEDFVKKCRSALFPEEGAENISRGTERQGGRDGVNAQRDVQE